MASNRHTELTDIQIINVNGLAHDKWQYLPKKGSKTYENFELIDNMVIQACQIHYEEMMVDGLKYDYLVPLSHGRVVNLNK